VEKTYSHLRKRVGSGGKLCQVGGGGELSFQKRGSLNKKISSERGKKKTQSQRNHPPGKKGKKVAHGEKLFFNDRSPKEVQREGKKG